MACVPGDWRDVLRVARERGSARLDGDQRAAALEAVEKLTTASSLSSGEPKAPKDDRQLPPVAALQAKLAALHAAYVRLLALRAEAAWPSNQQRQLAPAPAASKVEGGDAAAVLDADGAFLFHDAEGRRRRRDEAAAAEAAMAADVVALHRALKDRIAREAAVQRWCELQVSVQAKRRMAAALLHELAVANEATRLADRATTDGDHDGGHAT